MRFLVCLLALFAAMFLASCGKKPPVVQPQIVEVVRTIEVKVPTPVIVEVPPELLVPITAPLPVFVAPTHPDASSALTPEGERNLLGLLKDLKTRVLAWEAYYKELVEYARTMATK